MKRAAALLAFTALLSSCVAKPVLYPNDRLKQEGKEKARAEAAECDKQASEYIERSKNQKIAGEAAEGAAVGAAAGAVTGAVFGSLGRGALSGGLAGATIGVVRGIFHTRQPSPARQQFVNRCMAERGYVVVGWE